MKSKYSYSQKKRQLGGKLIKEYRCMLSFFDNLIQSGHGFTLERIKKLQCSMNIAFDKLQKKLLMLIELSAFDFLADTLLLCFHTLFLEVLIISFQKFGRTIVGGTRLFEPLRKRTENRLSNKKIPSCNALIYRSLFSTTKNI